jgi:hypothetical protein
MKFTNTSASLHMTREYRNSGKLLTCALCVLLALPGLAAAKKPPKNNSSNNTTSGSTTTEGCAVLLPAYIETGTSFSVKVVRVPSYPGGWTHPTIYTDVVYPMPAGESSTDSKTQTISNFSVTYALASFMAPSKTTGILNSPTTPEATAAVTVTVSEPLSNNNVKLTTCSSTTPVMEGY